MSDPTDAALDSWINWLEDLPLPKDFDEGVTGLQGFITALRTERAKDHAEINLKADFIEATLNQLAASEETIENLRAERDAAYARGVHDAAAIVRKSAELYASKDANFICSSAALDIEALAEAPPAPVVGVKPLVWMDIDGAGPIPCIYAGTPFGNYYIDYASTGNGRGYRAYFINGPTIYLGRDITAAKAASQADYEARILAALLPQAGGNDP